jgi:hypothetical protein
MKELEAQLSMFNQIVTKHGRWEFLAVLYLDAQ